MLPHPLWGLALTANLRWAFLCTLSISGRGLCWSGWFCRWGGSSSAWGEWGWRWGRGAFAKGVNLVENIIPYCACPPPLSSPRIGMWDVNESVGAQLFFHYCWQHMQSWHCDCWLFFYRCQSFSFWTQKLSQPHCSLFNQLHGAVEKEPKYVKKKKTLHCPSNAHFQFFSSFYCYFLN